LPQDLLHDAPAAAARGQGPCRLLRGTSARHRGREKREKREKRKKRSLDPSGKLTSLCRIMVNQHVFMGKSW